MYAHSKLTSLLLPVMNNIPKFQIEYFPNALDSFHISIWKGKK